MSKKKPKPKKGDAWDAWVADEDRRLWEHYLLALEAEREIGPNGAMGVDATGHPAKMAIGECVDNAYRRGLSYAEMHRQSDQHATRLRRRREWYIKESCGQSTLAIDVQICAEELLERARVRALRESATAEDRAELVHLLQVIGKLELPQSSNSGTGAALARRSGLPTEAEALAILAAARQERR